MKTDKQWIDGIVSSHPKIFECNDIDGTWLKIGKYLWLNHSDGNAKIVNVVATRSCTRPPMLWWSDGSTFQPITKQIAETASKSWVRLSTEDNTDYDRIAHDVVELLAARMKGQDYEED